MTDQSIRDAIRNLMKANDKRVNAIANAGELITAHESGVTSEIQYQNMMLQAILDARG